MMKPNTLGVLEVPEDCPLKIEGHNFLKAAWLGRLKLARLLVEGGTSVDLQNEDGQTALMISVLTDYEDSQSCSRQQFIKFLTENGCNPNIRDCTGSTALMYACKMRQHLSTVRVLLDCFSDPLIKDHNGCNSLHHAANSGYNEALKMLATTCKILGKDVIIIETQRSNPNSNNNSPNISQNKKFKSPKVLHRSLTERSLISTPSPQLSPVLLKRNLPSKQEKLKLQNNSFEKKLINLNMIANKGSIGSSSSPSSLSSLTSISPSGSENKTQITPDGPPSPLTSKHFSEEEETRNAHKSTRSRRYSLPNSIATDITLPSLSLTSSKMCVNFQSQENLLVNSTVELLNSGSLVSSESRATMGPRGKVLTRQGSGTKLVDNISLLRRGTLPPINFNTRPPIPDISSMKSVHRPLSIEEEQEDNGERDDEVKDLVGSPATTPPPAMFYSAKRRYSLQETGNDPLLDETTQHTRSYKTLND